MTISRKQILDIMPHAEKYVDKYLSYINEYAEQFGISTRMRMCHYLAQIAHESAELRYAEEIASGAAYEGRRDLGNTEKGDGKKFKGRGLIQITGRANYRAYNDYLTRRGMKVDLLKNPELLSKPLGAVKSSMWFWQFHGLNEMASMDTGSDSSVIVRITRKINGGTNGLTQRRLYFERAKLAIHD